MKCATLLISLFCFLLSAQGQTTIELEAQLKNAKHDTTRCNILSELIDEENDDNIWPRYNDQLLQLAESGASKFSRDTVQKMFYLKHLASALNNIGFLAQNQGEIPKALEYYVKSLKIEEEINNKLGIAYSLNNIGVIYKDQGDIAKALEYFHKSLKMREDLNDRKGIASMLTNIGIIHKDQGDAQRGLEYFQRSIKIQEEIGDKSGIASSLNNLGFIYDNHGDPSCHDSKAVCARAAKVIALKYYIRSLKLKEQINDKKGIANSLNNIGSVYWYFARVSQSPDSATRRRQLTETALEYYQNGLKIQEEIKDKQGIASSLVNIGSVFLIQGKTIEALELTKQSLQISKELGYPTKIMSAAAALKLIYKKQQSFKDAFEMYELEIQMRDSITNEETKKASIKKQFQYQYEKQAAADSVKNAQEQKVRNSQLTAQEAQLTQERTQRFALYGGLVLVIVFSVFVLKRFRITQKQKRIIENQKLLVDRAFKQLEEKNKEVLDSIHYAKKIQTALLPSEKYIDRKLNELIK